MRLFAAALLASTVSTPALAQASSETLDQAIASALESNPTLQARQQTRKSADESYLQARAAGLPSVGLSGSYALQNTEVGQSVTFGGRTFPNQGSSELATLGLEARQKIYSGGSISARTRSAQAFVDASEAQFRAETRQLILDVIGSYLDVRRAEAAVDIRSTNVTSLKTQIQAATDRFNVGEVTRTDVAQAQARAAGSEAQLAIARADLMAARARYEQLVGRPGIQLAAPPAAPVLPNSLEEAIAVAMKQSPEVLGRVALERSAEETLRAVRGDLMPKLDLFARAGLQESHFDQTFEDTAIAAGVELSVPLYQGGLLASRTRQSRLETDRARFERLAAERKVRSDVESAWHRVIAARQSIEASQSQVTAAETALNGAQQELAVGTRITLDVLDQERELLEARLGLIDAQRASFLATANLLGAMGALSPESFGATSPGN